MKKSTKIFLITTAVFTTEAIVHYNLGEAKQSQGNFKFKIPSTKEMIKIAGVAIGASIVSTILIEMLT